MAYDASCGQQRLSKFKIVVRRDNVSLKQLLHGCGCELIAN